MTTQTPRQLSRVVSKLLTLSLLGTALTWGGCNPSTSSPSDGGSTGGVCVYGPCSGTLSGAVSTSFNCTQTFGNYGLNTTAGTEFRLSVPNPPSGVTQLDMALDFVGAPPTVLPATVVFIQSPAPSVVLTPAQISLFLTDNSSFMATVGPPTRGDMSLTLSEVQYRDGGTPGDVCLHGHLGATLAHLSGATSGSVNLDATF